MSEDKYDKDGKQDNQERDNASSDRDRSTGAGDGEKSGEKRQRSKAEWISLLISVAILLALVGGLVYEMLAHNSRPPSIQVQPLMEEVRHEGDSYYLSVDVSNMGDKTAESVEVMLSLDSGEGEPETMQFQIQFLDGGETDNQTVIFRNDPSQGELTHTASFHVP